MTESPTETFSQPAIMVRLLHHHGPALRNFIARYVFNTADAEDVFQDACMVLWREQQHYKPNRPFLPWAWAVCRNQVRSLRHRQRNRPHILPLSTLAELKYAEDRVLPEEPGRAEWAISRLSEAERQLFYSFYQERQTANQLAAQSNQSPNAVYKSVARIRRKLKRLIVMREKACELSKNRGQFCP